MTTAIRCLITFCGFGAGPVVEIEWIPIHLLAAVTRKGYFCISSPKSMKTSHLELQIALTLASLR